MWLTLLGIRNPEPIENAGFASFGHYRHTYAFSKPKRASIVFGYSDIPSYNSKLVSK
jgi:hypothetical protein